MEETKDQAVNSKTEHEQVADAEKTQHSLALLEAALYVAGRPLDLERVMCGFG